jgi:enediyne biosynthesis protein E3
VVASHSRRRRPPPVTRSGHLDAIVDAFFDGYAAALESNDPGEIAARLTRLTPSLRGFGYEGAAMALALLDRLWPVRATRIRRFIDGAGNPHVYMIHVGAGWAAARLRRPAAAARAGLDDVLDWLAVDGYGFHEGYFHTEQAVRRAALPPTTHAYTRRAFDQGLGRSLWFVDACDPGQIAQTISRFAHQRRADLWSGVGLAAAYAGGVSASGLRTLRALAGVYQPQLAQGAAFAAEARDRAGNPAVHTDEACAALADTRAASCAAIVRQMRESLPGSADLPAYEHWRRRVASALARN